MKKILNIVDCSGKMVKTYELDSNIWKADFSLINISSSFYCQRAQEKFLIKGYREKKKNRAEVSGGGKKPWKQKGTGRARQGSIRAPQWRGGGVVFGPSGDKKFLPKLNKKSKKRSLKDLLSKKIERDKVIVLDNINLEQTKTKLAAVILSSIGVKNKSVLLILSNSNNEAAFRNISKLKIINDSFLDAIKIISFEFLVFTEDSFKNIEKRISKK